MQKYTNHSTGLSPFSQRHWRVVLCPGVPSVIFRGLCAMVMGGGCLTHLVRRVIFCLDPNVELTLQRPLPDTPSVTPAPCPPASAGWGATLWDHDAWACGWHRLPFCTHSAIRHSQQHPLHACSGPEWGPLGCRRKAWEALEPPNVWISSGHTLVCISSPTWTQA